MRIRGVTLTDETIRTWCLKVDGRPVMRRQIDRYLSALLVPVLLRLAVEPSRDQLTLPLGVMATFDVEERTLDIRESAVS